MSALLTHAARRAAARAPGGYGRVPRRFASEGAEKDIRPLSKGAKRDPELYVRHRSARRDGSFADVGCRSYLPSCRVPLAWLVSTLVRKLSERSAAGLIRSLGRKPTSASSESKVSIAENTMPWEKDSSTTGKYQYHPGGDKRKGKKDAPSALNSVIVPNVNLPKELHDRFNKWGKDGYN